MSENPLNQYFRAVEEYIALPSGTAYYDPSVIEFNDDGEVGIMAMTSKDEMLLKNPDSLLNGSSVTDMLKSCVPTLKDPKKLLQVDAEVLIVAIRKATFGDDMDFTTKCPKCEAENTFSLSLSELPHTVGEIEPEYCVEIREGLKVFVQPQTYESYVKTTKTVFNNFKKGQHVNAENESAFITQTYADVAQLQFELITDNILKIEIEGSGEAVVNKKHITEFIMNISAKEADHISNLIKEIGKIGINKTLNMSCQNCDHKWENETSFDPMSFFTQS